MKCSMVAVVSVVALTVLGSGPAAHAESIQYTVSLGPAYTDVPPPDLPAVTQFNPALGTLNSVALDLHSSFNAELNANNSGSSLGYVRCAVEDVAVSLQSPTLAWQMSDDLGYIVFVGTPPSTNATLANSIQVPAGQSMTPRFQSLATNLTRTLTDSTSLAEFTGVGSLALPYSAGIVDMSMYLYMAGGSMHGGISTTTAADLTVTYEYTPIPEPGSLVLLGLGAVSLFAFGWRSRTRTA